MIPLAQAANLPLVAWQNFYVIIGSSAGALIGLQFVMITLIASSRKHADLAAINAFGTPTVFHFAGALAVAAFMNVPWTSRASIEIALALFGFIGLGYAAIIFHRARRQTIYRPVFEDWVWHAILPSVCYVAVAGAALVMTIAARFALFVVAGASLGLLFIGIRNAWDAVTYLVLDEESDEGKPR